MPNLKGDISTFQYGYPYLTLNRGPQSNLTTLDDSQPIISHRLVSHCKPLGPIISNVLSTFKLGYPYLNFKREPKVKSDHIRRLPAHDFLEVGFTCQTSKTNNKGGTSIFKFNYPHMTLKAQGHV